MSPKAGARLYVETGLAAGAAVALSPGQAHQLRAVLRLGPGDAVTLFNTRDGEWLARIVTMTRGGCTVAPEQLLRAQEDEGDLWLVFAPIKRARLDVLIEKATELGVSALCPVITAHTNVERLNPDRLAAIAREAAEQSERLTLPEIRPAVPLARLLADWPAGRRLVLCDETGAAPPAAAALAALPAGPRAVLIGPEGGFAESELDALRKLPFVCPVGLGPRVLRSDTAAIAGLAVVQSLGGDWDAVRRRRLQGRAAPIR
jgi:16S rRNA (uracil1498-N3)-methyltransferase